MSLTADQVGFVPGRPGHALALSTKQRGYGANQYWDCTCGYQVYARYKNDGKVGKSGMRQWRQHLEAQDLPDDEIIPVGSVTRTRVVWELYVMSRSFAGVDEFANRTRFSRWAKAGSGGTYMDNYHWAVGVRRLSTAKGTVLGQSILVIARTKDEAITKARTFMQKEADDGRKIEHKLEDAIPLPLNPQSSFASLLTRLDKTCEEGNLVEVEALEAEVSQILALAPALQAGVERLAQRKEAVVADMLNWRQG